MAQRMSSVEGVTEGMGSSGAGKSTLLNCISTIDSVSAGKIILDGKEVNLLKDKMLARFRRENLGFIFQDFSLLDNLTIYDKFLELN